jgi:protein gp37
MNATEIKWTELTWNPASGCTKISPGCAYCYAHTLAENKRGTHAFPVGFDVVEKPHKLVEPARLKKPSLIFTNSMTDCFHASISDNYRDRIFSAIESAPKHRYQLLTKRPEVALRYFSTRKVPDCVWLGVTIENQAYTGRADILRQINARVRFVSMEPMLSHIDINLEGIQWVIVGGESGCHMSRPEVAEVRSLAKRTTIGHRSSWQPRDDRIDWVRDVRDKCARSGVAFFFKQWGGTRPTSAGRHLDGRTWEQFPSDMPDGYSHRAV